MCTGASLFSMCRFHFLPYLRIPHKREIGPQSIDMDIDPAARTKNTEHLAHHSLPAHRSDAEPRANKHNQSLHPQKEDAARPLHGQLRDRQPVCAPALHVSSVKSMPVARAPCFANCRRSLPVPHPISRTFSPAMLAKLGNFVKPGIGGVALLLGQKQRSLIPVSLGELCSVRHHSTPYRVREPIAWQPAIPFDWLTTDSRLDEFLPPESEVQQEPGIASSA